MPTATVRRGVVASDDRKRDAAQLRAPRPWFATTAQRRLRSSAAKDTAMVYIVTNVGSDAFAAGTGVYHLSFWDGAEGRIGQDTCLPESPGNGKGPP